MLGQQQIQCHEAMEKQTLEREAVYVKVPPPGNRIPRNTHTTNIDDNEPQDDEIRPVVMASKRGKAPGVHKVQAKKIKTWLWKME